MIKSNFVTFSENLNFKMQEHRNWNGSEENISTHCGKLSIGHKGIINPVLTITFSKQITCSNQIRVVAFNVSTVEASFIFTKKSNVANCFFDICNGEMAQSLSNLQKSEFLMLITVRKPL